MNIDNFIIDCLLTIVYSLLAISLLAISDSAVWNQVRTRRSCVSINCVDASGSSMPVFALYCDSICITIPKKGSIDSKGPRRDQ